MVMNRGPVFRFVIAWFVSSLGIWISAGILDNSINYNSNLLIILIGGFILAVINALIKPLVILVSLPAIVFTFGLFTIVINGLMVMLASLIYPPLQVSGFGAALLAGMVIGLINYLVSTMLERSNDSL